MPVKSSASGVYYATMPPGSGGIEFNNGIETVLFEPLPGELVVFPGWLPHRALTNEFPSSTNSGPSEGGVAGGAEGAEGGMGGEDRKHADSGGQSGRVSFSFDLRGPWAVSTRQMD
jgi:hypothetical protein